MIKYFEHKKFEIIGLKELEEALKDLDVKLQASIYRTLNRTAVKKFVVDTLKNQLNYSAKTEKNIQTISDRNDPTGMYGGIHSDAFYLRFADKGTVSRHTKKGAFRGQIIGKKQIQPIILGSVEEIIKYMNEELGTEIQKTLEKRIKSVNKKIAKL